MDLEPEGRPGPAAAEEDPLDPEAVRRGVLQDVARPAGGRLVQGADDMARAVGQREARDHPARLRVLVGGAVPLPVVADDQAVGPGRRGRGLLVEHLVDVHAAAIGLDLLGAGEVAAIPVEDRPGGGLPGLDRVQPLDGRIGVAAGRPGAEDPRLRLREVAGARADDHRDVSRPGRPHAEHPEIGVDPPLRHRGPLAEPEGLGRRPAQGRLAASQRHDRLGPLGEEVVEADGLQQRQWASPRRASRSSTSRRRDSGRASIARSTGA